MKISGIDAVELKNQIAEIVKNQLKGKSYKLFFFGSRVDGSAGDRSDIDIGIIANGKIGAGDMLEIREGLENLPVLYKMEFVDFADASEKFKSVALKNIEIITENE